MTKRGFPERLIGCRLGGDDLPLVADDGYGLAGGVGTVDANQFERALAGDNGAARA